VEGLTAPLDRRTRSLLRRAVLDLAESRQPRVHPPVLHLGTPGGPAASMALDGTEPADPGLRTDIVAALRVRAGSPADALVWLTRSGDLDLEDIDAHWLSAALAAHVEAGAPLTFVVVNRHGWRDPRSGLGRTWARLRRGSRSGSRPEVVSG
jgi:hypothetical protein